MDSTRPLRLSGTNLPKRSILFGRFRFVSKYNYLLAVFASEPLFVIGKYLRESIVADGKFFAAAGDAKISAVDVRDIAAVAVAALTEQGHEGRTYDLTGPEALTHAEMAEKLSKGLNRQIEYVDVPPQGMLETLLRIGLPQWQADGLIEDYEHYRRGEAATIATGVRDATGAAPRSFDQFVSDYSSAFS